MARMFLFLLGFGFMVIGFSYIITYLNLLTMGYKLEEYINFIFTRAECIISLIGLVIVTIIILTGGYTSNDLHI